MNKQLCSTAEQRQSWKFLAQECEAEAKVLATRECAGRSYTAMSKSSYKDFCSAYGVEGMASDSAAGAAAATPVAEEKAEESKVKRGLKGLKGALGL